MEESKEHECSQVEADETDDAEIQAILYAIDSLAKKLDRLTIICDHQSVVCGEGGWRINGARFAKSSSKS